MSEEHTIKPPAKLNLSLRVLGKRDDGFHEIDTRMITLPGLHDTLTFKLSNQDHFRCNLPDLPIDKNNLVIAALEIFREHTGSQQCFEIHLEKRIPHGAGLGGGSSDAASVLQLVSKLTGENLASDELQMLALKIGSDVPFFLGSGSARATGRGEQLTALARPAPLTVVLLKPSFGVSTPDAYHRWGKSIELPNASYLSQDLGDIELVNDLERPVFQKFLFLAQLKGWLTDQPETTGALMSGSGATVFAVLGKEMEEAGRELVVRAKAELDPTLWSWVGSL